MSDNLNILGAFRRENERFDEVTVLQYNVGAKAQETALASYLPAHHLVSPQETLPRYPACTKVHKVLKDYYNFPALRD